MGFFDDIGRGFRQFGSNINSAVSNIGNGISGAVQSIGQKATDAANFIGTKLKDALPVIGNVADAVSKIAPTIADVVGSFGAPGAVASGIINGIGRGAGMLGGYISSGKANNNLETAKTIATKVADASKFINNGLGTR